MNSKKTATRPLAVKAAPAIAVVEQRPAVKATQRHGFKLNEYIVYPAHGVGQILAIEEQEVACASIEQRRAQRGTAVVIGRVLERVLDPSRQLFPCQREPQPVARDRWHF